MITTDPFEDPNELDEDPAERWIGSRGRVPEKEIDNDDTAPLVISDEGNTPPF